MKPKYRIEFLEEAIVFIENLEKKVREKILYNLKKAQLTNDQKIFKKLNKNIWEFRTVYNRTHYRLFAFWDKTDKTNTLVISTHGIEKKTQKTPKKEIEKAENLRKRYFNELKK